MPKKEFAAYAHRQDMRSEPLRYIPYAEARRLADARQGWFFTAYPNGRRADAFRFYDPKETGCFEEVYKSSTSPKLHGQSCDISEAIIIRYVAGDDFLARLAVEGWRDYPRRRNSTRVRRYRHPYVFENLCLSLFAKFFGVRWTLRKFPGTLRRSIANHIP